MTPETMSLFDAPTTAGRVRARDPITSLYAARRTNAHDTEAEIEALVLGDRSRDWTADDLSAALSHRPEQSVKTAFSRVKKRLGMTQTGIRPSALGSPMSAWKAAS